MHYLFQINRLYKFFLLFLFSILNFKELQPFISLCFFGLKYLSGNRLQTNKFPQSFGVKDIFVLFFFCLDFVVVVI